MTNTDFNHIQWLKDFNQALHNKFGFKELRAEIFKQTIHFVQKGTYKVDGNQISIADEKLVKTTAFFDREFKLGKLADEYKTAFSVINADCLETAQLLVKSGLNACVLNLASRKNPGGGVVNGAGAQEENLFRRSNLFLSLYQFASYSNDYGILKHHNQYPLDSCFGGIYSPEITVFRGSEQNGYFLLRNPFKVAFVSVPAISHPDLINVDSQLFLAKSMIESTKNKMRTILRIAGKNGHDSLVLGAFGCGAFANPPHHIALLFKEIFAEEEFINRFRLVVFSIIDDNNSHREHNPLGNILPFQEVFDNKER
jgi:uncharacterized protein (TIGR02452 family)